ncbi:MAG: phenylacetic acid degradation operon negative regulatory protein PaaX [Steroidobacteraceae bacterium]|jgi:phenylacetic acid degradation operon negative regulatory protein
MRTAAATRELLARFRRQRPLRGGSLIVTMFGDSIMPRGGAIALGSLIRLAAPFGLNERLVRTAAARLAHDGWLEARRSGKLSEYRLSKGGRERFAEATQRIYGGAPAHWTGRWTLIVLPAVRAAERQRLRKELSWQGFGELSSGVFAHPETPSDEVALQTWSPPLPAGALIFDANLANGEAPARLVEMGWDLADLAKRYRRFVQRCERASEALGLGTIEPQGAFVLRTLLIHEYRRLHLRDPMLPRTLLPELWPGTRAAELCRDLYVRVFAPSELHLSSVATRLSGALPAPDRTIMQRFGGLARR